jgi:uncharacterized protein (DUF4415 family)
MQKTITTRSGRLLILPTEAEEAQINAGIAADPDTHSLTDEEWETVKHTATRGRPLGSGSKIQVTLRLDIDVVNKLKAGGTGWQTRANAALRKAVLKSA